MRKQTTERCCLSLTLLLVAFSATRAAEPSTEPKDAQPTAASKGAAAWAATKRVDVAIDRSKFGEGWSQTIPLDASPGDSYRVSVSEGWLHVRRQNIQGALDWQIMLAKVADDQPPKISLIPGALVFDLSYADGRYFIRETGDALRSAAGVSHANPERLDPTSCSPTGATTSGATLPPALTRSVWMPSFD